MDESATLLAESPDDAARLAKTAVRLLQDRLPQRWTVELQPSVDPGDGWDLLVKTAQANAQNTLLMETRQRFAPRDVAELTSGIVRRLRDRTTHLPLLLVAPYF